MRILATTLLVLCTILGNAQSDAILGTWLNEDKDAKIKVYEEDGLYYGKLIWLANDVGPDGVRPKRDANNPKAAKRNEPLKGKILLKDLRWEADDKEWTDGTIYDPKSGSTYDLFARLEDRNTLYLKGYIGFSLIGRSTLWSRVD